MKKQSLEEFQLRKGSFWEYFNFKIAKLQYITKKTAFDDSQQYKDLQIQGVKPRGFMPEAVSPLL